MSSPKSQDDGQTEEAYLASYESSNRKRKLLIIGIAVVAIILVGAAFLGTIGSLGQMNEDVQGAFLDGAPAEGTAEEGDTEAAPASDTVPAGEETPAPEMNEAPAESGVPAEGSTPAEEAPSTPTETGSDPAP